MSREELENYQRVGKELEEFCEIFVDKLYKIDSTLCYPYYDRMFVEDNVLDITTYSISYGDYETKTKTIDIPLQVIYENKIDEYINKLHNDRLTEAEEKEKAKYEKDRQSAIDTINKLKAKYNL